MSDTEMLDDIKRYPLCGAIICWPEIDATLIARLDAMSALGLLEREEITRDSLRYIRYSTRTE